MKSIKIKQFMWLKNKYLSEVSQGIILKMETRNDSKIIFNTILFYYMRWDITILLAYRIEILL